MSLREDTSIEMATMKKKLHVLVIAFPGHGHVNPLLHLSTRLALHGVKVSFVLARALKANMEMAREEAGISTPHQHGLDLHFLEIPDIKEPEYLSLGAIPALEQMLHKMESHRGLVEQSILQSRDGPDPITCVISDNFLSWTQDMANKLGIKRIWVSTSNCTTFSTSLLISMDKVYAEVEDFLPSLDSRIKKEIMTAFAPNPQRKKLADILFCGIGESFCTVVNSFKDLESHIVDNVSVMGTTGVEFLDPILPPSFFGMDTAHIEASISGACAHKEEVDCIKWLDIQTASSILYIAFGTVGVLTPNQIEEIASGIEKSQQALWVLRSPADPYLPFGFMERSHALGLIVSWGPQLHVLRHKSIGGFLTHYGWNSTIESICAGVPMLCLPIFADQPINSLLRAILWKVGMALEKTQLGEDENGVVMMVTKEEVERKVRALMGGNENIVVDMRHRAQSLKDVARKA